MSLPFIACALSSTSFSSQTLFFCLSHLEALSWSLAILSCCLLFCFTEAILAWNSLKLLIIAYLLRGVVFWKFSSASGIISVSFELLFSLRVGLMLPVRGCLPRLVSRHAPRSPHLFHAGCHLPARWAARRLCWCFFSFGFIVPHPLPPRPCSLGTSDQTARGTRANGVGSLLPALLRVFRVLNY